MVKVGPVLERFVGDWWVSRSRIKLARSEIGWLEWESMRVLSYPFPVCLLTDSAACAVVHTVGFHCGEEERLLTIE